MAALATIATIATLGATVISTVASVQQGAAAQREGYRQAAVDELAGKNELAASQRDAEERRMEGKLIMSRQQAFAAASGGGSGADDPTIMKILSDTGERAEYGAESIMYQGQARHDDYYASAAARRETGQNNFFGGLLRGVGSLAGGIGHLAEMSA